MSKIGILLCLVATTVALETQEPLQEFSNGNQKFSADVLKVVFTDEHNKGIISPLSVQLVLALTAEGAEGDTYDQLRKAVSLPDKERTTEAVKALLPILNKSAKDFNVSLADKLYIDNKFKVKRSFKKVAVSAYQSDIQNVNFAKSGPTADLINKWVESKTNDKIKNLIRPNQLTADTELVLVNAVYLSGKWQTPFPPSKTSKKPFHYLNKKVEDVDTMHSAENSRYLYRRCGFLQAQFLEIPFEDSTVSVTFVLPDAQDGIVELHKHVELFLEPHNLTLQRVAVSLPKFSASTYHDFKEIVSKLGATKVFSKEADLSGISEEKDLYVDFIQQKAFINITEAGVEAAAATAVGVGTTSIQEPPKLTFNADHPFFYYIRENKSKVILFVGRYQ
ncbi:antichymotrypsin-2-like isoform X2 [Anoplophora glabripennis]|uniref:antichymotrypsin-2-like isoform X2 n=1 Tax=Anoplophora glabripennis TaxID=217634 RepID=UPI000874A9CB|nr:antichymotrypsin-2-like isoform X2 [Anoplophora glabripennis]